MRPNGKQRNYNKKTANKIKSDNLKRGNRERFNIAIAKSEKFIALNLFRFWRYQYIWFCPRISSIVYKRYSTLEEH